MHVNLYSAKRKRLHSWLFLILFVLVLKSFNCLYNDSNSQFLWGKPHFSYVCVWIKNIHSWGFLCIKCDVPPCEQIGYPSLKIPECCVIAKCQFAIYLSAYAYWSVLGTPGKKDPFGLINSQFEDGYATIYWPGRARSKRECEKRLVLGIASSWTSDLMRRPRRSDNPYFSLYFCCPIPTTSSSTSTSACRLWAQLVHRSRSAGIHVVLLRARRYRDL